MSSTTSASTTQMGVFVTHNEKYTSKIQEPNPTPMIATQPLRGAYLHDESLWHPLPLTDFLGLPLQYMRLDCLDQTGKKYYNETIVLLSIDPQAPSPSFCKPTIPDANISAFVKRADGGDLGAHEVQALVEFIKNEMTPLVAAARDATDGEQTEDEWEGCSDGEATEDEGEWQGFGDGDGDEEQMEWEGFGEEEAGEDGHEEWDGFRDGEDANDEGARDVRKSLRGTCPITKIAPLNFVRYLIEVETEMGIFGEEDEAEQS